MEPTLVVVDDFLEDPDDWRACALRQEYAPDGSKGVRSRDSFRGHPVRIRGESFPSFRAAFSFLLGRRIRKWDYPINGRFQWCGAQDPLVFHADSQDWAGALFLTPGAPAKTGTSLHRSKRTGLWTTRGATGAEIDGAFGHALFDSTAWEEVDRVGNVYNRLVLWDARRPHSASGYFGHSAETARLFMVFFFDLEPGDSY